jgi:hypothetical protein
MSRNPLPASGALRPLHVRLLGACALVVSLCLPVAATAQASLQVIGAGPPRRSDVGTVQIRHLVNNQAIAGNQVSPVSIFRTEAPTNNYAQTDTQGVSVGPASDLGTVIILVVDNTLNDPRLDGLGTVLAGSLTARMDSSRNDQVGVYLVDRETGGGVTRLAPTTDPGAVRGFLERNLTGKGAQSPVFQTTRSAVEALANDLSLPPRREVIVISDGLDEICQSSSNPESCIQDATQQIGTTASGGAVPVSVSALGVNILRPGRTVDRRWISSIEALAVSGNGTYEAVAPNNAGDVGAGLDRAIARAKSVFLHEVKCISDVPLSDRRVSLEAAGRAKAKATSVGLEALHCETLAAVCARFPGACSAAAAPPPSTNTSNGSGAAAPSLAATEAQAAGGFSTRELAAVGAAVVALLLGVALWMRNRKRQRLEQERLRNEEARRQRERDEQARASASSASSPQPWPGAELPVAGAAGSGRVATQFEAGAGFMAGNLPVAQGPAPGAGAARTTLEKLHAAMSQQAGAHLVYVTPRGEVGEIPLGAGETRVGLDAEGQVVAMHDHDGRALLVVSVDGGTNATVRATRSGLESRRFSDGQVVERPITWNPGDAIKLQSGAWIELRLLSPGDRPPYGASTRRQVWTLTTEGPGASARITLSFQALALGRQPDAEAEAVATDLASLAPYAAAKISGRHAYLWCSGGVPFVLDRGSANGTFVNGQRIEPWTPAPLRNYDTVGFSSLLTLRVGAP